MTPLDFLLLGVVLVLIAINAAIALAETALTRMSIVKALTLQDQGRRGAHRLARLMERPERWLNPLLFVNLVCSSTAAGLITILADHLFGAWGVVGALGFEVLFVFVVAEAIPKTWAIQHPERSAILSAPLVAGLAGFPPIRALARGLIAVSNLLIPGAGLHRGPFVSEEELLTMADVASVEDVIEHEERALIHSIIEFGDTVVREVRVPRPDMIVVNGDEPTADVLTRAIEAGYSRIPVAGESVDDIVGIVFTKDLMRAVSQGQDRQPVRTLVRPAHFVPETKRVSELMREMQREKFHIAIVVDEYGGTAGLVTLEDLIEELVGEIVDEFDVEEPLIEWLPSGEARVSARMAVDEVNDLLRARLPENDDWDSIGGLVLHELGHVPVEGEQVEVSGWVLTAERVQGRRVGRVRMTPPLRGPTDAGAETVEETLRRIAASRGGGVRSGFVTLVGRPNVGKSTLLNAILGTKVSIVSNKPQTTRTQVRGVLNRPDAQAVFVDTPGIHRAKTTLGSRLNDTAVSTIGDVDVVVLVIAAGDAVGGGDRHVAGLAPPDAVVVLNKVDRVGRDQVPVALSAAYQALGDSHEYFPVSARTGAGVEHLVEHLVARLPEGPRLYPEDVVTDVPEAFWVAELVREQLLAVTHDEVPHSVACVVTEWEWPRVRCEIFVERDSQKGIVIGKQGAVLKEVGTNVRAQLDPHIFLELAVRVEPDWQRRPAALNKLGY